MAVKDDGPFVAQAASHCLVRLIMFIRYYPTETIVSKKARKHYRIPVRSQYVAQFSSHRMVSNRLFRP